MRLEDNVDTFLLKDEHIKLIRKMYFKFDNSSAYGGAPMGDVKRPYGNQNHFKDMINILGLEVKLDDDNEPCISLTLGLELVKLHQETATAIEVVLTSGAFIPGLYERKKYSSDPWTKIENMY